AERWIDGVWVDRDRPRGDLLDRFDQPIAVGGLLSEKMEDEEGEDVAPSDVAAEGIGRTAAWLRSLRHSTESTDLLSRNSSSEQRLLEETRNASVGGAAEHDLQDHAAHADHQAGQHQHRVIEQATDADHHHPQRRKRVT